MKAQGPGTTGNVLGQCTLFPVLRCWERPGRTGNGQVPLHQDPTRLLPVRPSCSECCVVPWTASPKHQTGSLVPRLGDAKVWVRKPAAWKQALRTGYASPEMPMSSGYWN